MKHKNNWYDRNEPNPAYLWFVKCHYAEQPSDTDLVAFSIDPDENARIERQIGIIMDFLIENRERINWQKFRNSCLWDIVTQKKYRWSEDAVWHWHFYTGWTEPLTIT